MTTQTLVRAWPADLEIRGDGRTVYGLAAPFNSPADIFEHGRRFTEQIAPGAFARSIAERGHKVKLMVAHDHGRLPIGRAIKLAEDRAGLVGEFRVSNTRDGDEALELVRDGAVDSFSIGFAMVRDDWKGEQRTLLEVALHEVSLVSVPAYSDALIGGVRTAAPPATPLYTSALMALQLRKREVI